AVYWNRGGIFRICAALVLAAVVVQAAANFTQPLRQVFPPEFRANASRVLSAALVDDLGPYEMLNCDFLRDPTYAMPIPQGATVLMSDRHPFQFTPYLFEGYTAMARRAFLERDLTMRLVRLKTGEAPYSEYPGVIKLGLRFPERPKEYLPEPLVSAGKFGSGELLFFKYVDPANDPDLIQFG